METPDSSFEPIKCYHCNAVNDCATSAKDASPFTPQDGDIGICVKCANPFVVNGSYVGRCRALDPNEFNELDDDIKQQLIVAKQFCQEWRK